MEDIKLEAEFSQTLQSTLVDDDPEKKSRAVERSQLVLNSPQPPTPWTGFTDGIRKSCLKWKNELAFVRSQPLSNTVVSLLQGIFPILVWGQNYNATKLKRDLLAGLTIASLCIPQSIGYATLANLDPRYGLYTSAVPPLVYAVMGSSREVAIGPVAVVSLLLSSTVKKLQDPTADPIAYTKLVLAATFFAGIFQATFGLFRLGFLVDFLSHATLVGFVAGAAIIIGLQQLKGLLGISHFTNRTDVISVVKAVEGPFGHKWDPRGFILGMAFMIFILISRFVGTRKKKLFWLPAIAPLLSVILSTLAVYITRADKNGVVIVKHIKAGLNPISIQELQLDGPYVGEVVKIGLLVAIVALTESVAVGRSFASKGGYNLDGNKEMLSLGFMNMIGSFTSCYVATGSFSRTAVNHSAGCETLVSNLVMAVTVLICLKFFACLLYFTPKAVLASVILSALPGLIDFNEARRIWITDKLDFLACIGAFFGVMFASVEMGLLVGMVISFAKIILISIRPDTGTLGKIPGTEHIFCDVEQYPVASKLPGIVIIHVKSPFLCFANANFVRERILRRVAKEEAEATKGNTGRTIQLVILDICNLVSIDAAGIAALEELQNNLVTHGKELAIANPRWQVIHKLKLFNFVNKIEGRVFLTIAEAVLGCKGQY